MSTVPNMSGFIFRFAVFFYFYSCDFHIVTDHLKQAFGIQKKNILSNY
jgi:hypothetical protein